MGNTHNKNSQNRTHKQSTRSNFEGQASTSQFSISAFGNLSSRSVTSNQSVYSASRPWSRVSRRRWNDSTLTSPLEASKTAWPVPHRESIFLPEFPISTDLIHQNFEVKQLIAKGGYGAVYKVKKVSEGKEYALKVLKKSDIIKENAIRQVKEEARIHSAVGHHPFIVGAVERWQSKKVLYIVSEYIPGGELLALLDKLGKLPEELVKIFVAEIALAIDFLHNAGIIYRDLKPENILLDENYHIQLTDFGLSKWLSFGARTATLCGTLKYMAPEVLSRQPYGHAVDWWSLGVIACRMLTDQYPTPGAMPRAAVIIGTGDSAKDSPAKVHGAAGQAESSKPAPGTLPAGADDLSAAARGLLMRLLERDPQARMRSLRQLQQSAFFMRFDFDLVKHKKISPKDVLEHHFPDVLAKVSSDEAQSASESFQTVDL